MVAPLWLSRSTHANLCRSRPDTTTELGTVPTLHMSYALVEIATRNRVLIPQNNTYAVKILSPFHRALPETVASVGPAGSITKLRLKELLFEPCAHKYSPKRSR